MYQAVLKLRRYFFQLGYDKKVCKIGYMYEVQDKIQPTL